MRRRLGRRITHSRLFQNVVGTSGALYLQLVWQTSRLVLDPADMYERIEADLLRLFLSEAHKYAGRLVRYGKESLGGNRELFQVVDHELERFGKKAKKQERQEAEN